MMRLCSFNDWQLLAAVFGASEKRSVEGASAGRLATSLPDCRPVHRLDLACPSIPGAWVASKAPMVMRFAHLGALISRTTILHEAHVMHTLSPTHCMGARDRTRK